MKKFKKLLAGLLAGAMMLGSMTTTAFAEDNAGTTKHTVTPATIDTNLKGSLTIHKYEYNGSEKPNATGEAADADNKPESAKPLDGAGFTIYQVADVDDLTNYYSTNPSSLPAVKDYINEETINGVKHYTIKDNVYSLMKNEQKTKNGVTTFTDLALGFYVVIETTTPDKVTTAMDPFLVSIPMTTVDGDNWLYDVHVFPKNKTTYGGVTLKKIGNRDEDTKLSGVTFVLQKQIAGIWTPVVENESTGTALSLVTDKKGEITVDGLSQGTYRFIETDRGNNEGYIMDGATTYVFVVGADGKITYNGNTTNDLTIIVNNEKPNVEKEVKTANGWGDAYDYSAGDEVPYRVTVDVPENIAKLVDFTLTDTMLRQTYEDNSLKIYSDPQLENEILLNDDGQPQYTVNISADKKEWSIAFNSKNENTITSLLSGYAGNKIYISFSTILEEDALTTKEGNPNTVKLEYSNKILPSSNEDGNPNTPSIPSKDEISDQATVYTFKIAVEKVDAENENTKLKGVKFDLYRKLADNATGDGVLTNPVNGLTGKYEKVKANLTTGENGSTEVNGLENGTYYLVETQTNEGYNLLKAPVEVKIQATYSTKTTTKTTTDENGITTTTKVVENKTFENAGDNGVFKTVVKNRKGFQLPTTGGMGTVIFSVLGIALVLAGLLVITASRKKAAK